MDSQAQNSALDPLQQKKIRQALNYGFDRARMLRTLRNDVGRPATSGFAPRGLPSFDDASVQGYRYDPVLAARLLAEAGFPKGKNLPEITLFVQSGVPRPLFLDHAAMGRPRNKSENRNDRNGAAARTYAKGLAPFFRASWIADYPDAESFFTCFYSKNAAPPNYTRFRNAGFDKLYEAALSETNTGKRYALYRQMEKILIEEAPVVFLFYDETAQFATKNVTGLPRNAINLLSLKRVRK